MNDRCKEEKLEHMDDVSVSCALTFEYCPFHFRGLAEPVGTLRVCLD